MSNNALTPFVLPDFLLHLLDIVLYAFIFLRHYLHISNVETGRQCGKSERTFDFIACKCPH